MAPPKKGAKKKANGYVMPDPLPDGEILTDTSKKQWKLGPSIGTGGFGAVYSAQEVGNKLGNYVIKIEPHENGPLFVEMHCYMRIAKIADVEEFRKKKGLSTFGMPVVLGTGSHEYENKKYRFIVMPKFGTDLWKLYLANNKQFPSATVFKIGLQMLDVLEYIHSKGYIHADIKGTNILLGLEKDTKNQTYLVDFGLASRYTKTKEFKPDPKKAHNGTIEYLSRDAHKGVQTKRGDLEILAYNLIHWLGGILPWEKKLSDPHFVEASKIASLTDIPNFIETCFSNKPVPDAILKFLEYVESLDFNSDPNYKKLHDILLKGLTSVSGSLSSPLQFKENLPKKRASSKDRGKPKKVDNKNIASTSTNENQVEVPAKNSRKKQKTLTEDFENKSKTKSTLTKGKRGYKTKKSVQDEKVFDDDQNPENEVVSKTISAKGKHKHEIEEQVPVKRSRKAKERREENNEDEEENSLQPEKQVPTKRDRKAKQKPEEKHEEDEENDLVNETELKTMSPKRKHKIENGKQILPIKRGRKAKQEPTQPEGNDEEEQNLSENEVEIKPTSFKGKRIPQKKNKIPAKRGKQPKQILTEEEIVDQNQDSEENETEIKPTSGKRRLRQTKNDDQRIIEENDENNYEGYTEEMKQIQMKIEANKKQKVNKRSRANQKSKIVTSESLSH